MFLVPSSSGLGRGPLKAATRVQIPLGSPIHWAACKMAVFSFAQTQAIISKILIIAKRKMKER